MFSKGQRRVHVICVFENNNMATSSASLKCLLFNIIIYYIRYCLRNFRFHYSARHSIVRKHCHISLYSFTISLLWLQYRPKSIYYIVTIQLLLSLYYDLWHCFTDIFCEITSKLFNTSVVGLLEFWFTRVFSKHYSLFFGFCSRTTFYLRVG